MSESKNNASYFESLSYPAQLEIRAICDASFDCAHFINQKGLSPLDEAITPSKNNKFKTYKFSCVFKSYEDYIALRTQLIEHQNVQVIL